MQGVDANRPLLGIDTIDFDGSNDVLAAVGPAISQPCTLVSIYKDWSFTSPASTLMATNTGLGPKMSSFTATSHRLQASLVLGYVATITAGGHVTMGVFNGASSEAYLDSVSQAVGDTGPDSLIPIVLGARLATGTDSTQFKLYEALILSGAAVQADATAIQSYAVSKYGI